MPISLTTEVKKLKGTLQPCRTNPNEPTPPVGAPAMPKELSASGKKYWTKIVVTLDEMSTLTTADVYAIECLAQAMGDRLDARKALDARGGALSYETSKGMFVAYPELAMINAADKRVYQYLGKLGLTPADRSRVSAVGKDDEISMDWLNG